MLTGKKAVIFDLDGTLIDSMWVWAELDRVYMKKYNLTPPSGFSKQLEGKSYTETAQFFLDVFPDLPCTLDEIKEEWLHMTKELYRTKVELKPGVREFLVDLKKRHILTGIATSNTRELVEITLRELGIINYFDVIRTACEVERGKPFPDVYLKVAEDLQVSPRECLVFEDVPKGIEAGKNAGMQVCAVEDYFSKEERAKKKEQADFFIQTYDQIAKETYERCRK
ncbi:MAG: HAD family phosphatase [Candidatus Ruminococcus intestinipullorum]|nr:HAD family phosphatase [Candidatus Ruminococcus intestinipullorum]